MKNRKKDLVVFEYENKRAKIQLELQTTLKDLIKSDIPIIVEGKRDKEALVEIGVKENRILLVSHKTVFEIVDLLTTNKAKEVINLLDGDLNGKKKSSELYQNSKGIKINREIRRIIFKHVKSKRIEDLLNYLERNEIVKKFI